MILTKRKPVTVGEMLTDCVFASNLLLCLLIFYWLGLVLLRTIQHFFCMRSCLFGNFYTAQHA